MNYEIIIDNLKKNVEIQLVPNYYQKSPICNFLVV